MKVRNGKYRIVRLLACLGLLSVVPPIFSQGIPEFAYGAWQSEKNPMEFIALDFQGTMALHCEKDLPPYSITEITVKNKNTFCGIVNDGTSTSKSCFKITGKKMDVVTGKVKNTYNYVGPGEREMRERCEPAKQ